MSKQAKKIDLKQLYKIIYEQGPISKPEIAESCGISLTAISEYTNQLEEIGMIISTKKGTSSGGRKPLLYEADDEFWYIVGVDLRASHFYIFVSDLRGKVVNSQIIELQTSSYDQYLETLTLSMGQVKENLSLAQGKVLAVGMSVSGVTDFDNQIIDRSNELDWTNKPLGKDLSARLGLPVFIDTEVRIYARNEIELDQSKNVTSALYINEGIGLALIINNEIFHGYTNRAGDNRFFGEGIDKLYHVLKTDPLLRKINRLPYYSASIKRDQVEVLNQQFTEHVADPRVRETMDAFALYIARLMIAQIQMLNPKKVLLTGNVFDYNDFIYHQVKNRMMEDASMYHTPEIKRNIPGSGSLEHGIVRFVMEKFFEHGTVPQEVNDALSHKQTRVL